MVTGADVDVEPPAAGLLELELLLEPQPAIPAMSAAAARPATADTPKCLRNTIGPPVSAPSGSTAAPARPRGERAPRGTCLENRSDVSSLSTGGWAPEEDRHRIDIVRFASAFPLVSAIRRVTMCAAAWEVIRSVAAG